MKKTPEQWRAISEGRLRLCRPDLAALVLVLFDRADSRGWDLVVTDGLRSPEEQARRYAQGRTAPGRRVSDAPPGRSPHQYGCAVDLAFLHRGEPCWCEAHPWQQFGELAEVVGLRWGGRFPHPDRPHLQLRGWLLLVQQEQRESLDGASGGVG